MSSNRVSILYLTADNADADVVGSLVGIVREVQGGGSVERVSTPVVASVSASIGEIERPALSVAKATRVYKARAPKPALHTKAPKDAAGRAQGSGPAVLAAMASGAPLDRNKLAKAIYGDSSAESLTKINHAIAYNVRTGKAKKNADGSYTVIG